MNRAALLVPLLLVAACSGSSPSRTPAAVQATAPVPPLTATPSTEPSTEPTTGPTPSPASSPVPTASTAAAGVRALDGDVDGDGKSDRIRVSGSTLTVTLSRTGRVLTTSVDAGLDGQEPTATAGSFDVDRDGHAEVFVRVAQGASTSTLRPFRYDGQVLAPVNTPDSPLLLVVGGSVTHGDGFSCTDAGRLVVRSAESNDGTAFTITTTTYRLSGQTAVRLTRTVARASGMGDPAVGAAYRVDCGTVGEGD